MRFEAGNHPSQVQQTDLLQGREHPNQHRKVVVDLRLLMQLLLLPQAIESELLSIQSEQIPKAKSGFR
jgi:hypothetical protein